MCCFLWGRVRVSASIAEVLITTSAQKAWQVYGLLRAVENGYQTTKSGVSLTFDDGPDPVWTPRVLEALKKAEVRATFFVVGPLVRRFPEVVRGMLSAGHGVEFHCTEHVRHTWRSREEVREDTRAGLADLRRHGVSPRFWRPPWGVCAPWTREVAGEFGLEVALWTEDTHDWRGDTAGEMFSRVRPGMSAGSVVLMHDGLGPGARRTGCGETVALIPTLADHTRQLGCEPAPLGEVFTVPERVSG